MHELFRNAYAGRKVLITGHTGFKGSWISLWLSELGADVIGFALEEPPTEPSHFAVAGIAQRITDVRGDIRDLETLCGLIETHRPEIVFHMAAQPIVLRAVAEPHATFETNAMGTVNLLESLRRVGGVRALVSIATDKVYDNQEWVWGYRESDRLGGNDPYSASKSMAELATHAYANTYFPAAKYETHGLAIASARAGNVIGGGDFALYRLVPDCMRALLSSERIGVRNPGSVRPWQHVLEPLSGYLWLGARLLKEGPAFGGAWNFGPLEHTGVTTAEVVEELVSQWGSGDWERMDAGFAKVETGTLRLSWEKAGALLGWRPVYAWKDALAEIVGWFNAFQRGDDMHAVGEAHIGAFVERARALHLPWAESP
jgi:CDP-glucose 4,6-dehydratase